MSDSNSSNTNIVDLSAYRDTSIKARVPKDHERIAALELKITDQKEACIDSCFSLYNSGLISLTEMFIMFRDNLNYEILDYDARELSITYHEVIHHPELEAKGEYPYTYGDIKMYKLT